MGSGEGEPMDIGVSSRAVLALVLAGAIAGLARAGEEEPFLDDLDRAIAAAKRDGKPLFVDFTHPL